MYSRDNESAIASFLTVTKPGMTRIQKNEDEAKDNRKGICQDEPFSDVVEDFGMLVKGWV